MSGMNHSSGRALEGVPHLNQSIARILSTPLGSRITRHTFGSEVPVLIDAPTNAITRVRLFAATAAALMAWEPRLKLSRVGLQVDPSQPGAVVIEIEGTTTLSRDRVQTTVAINRTGSTA